MILQFMQIHEISYIYRNVVIGELSLKRNQKKVKLLYLQVNIIHSNRQLYKCEVDYKKNCLYKIQEYVNPSIQGFSQINLNQNLLLISEKYIRIIDLNGNVVSQIAHKQDHRKYNQIMENTYVYQLKMKSCWVQQQQNIEGNDLKQQINQLIINNQSCFCFKVNIIFHLQSKIHFMFFFFLNHNQYFKTNKLFYQKNQNASVIDICKQTQFQFKSSNNLNYKYILMSFFLNVLKIPHHMIQNTYLLKVKNKLLYKIWVVLRQQIISYDQSLHFGSAQKIIIL
ncbi:hypothetical protein pb186bvf_020934 [Paramecium bursaria]